MSPSQASRLVLAAIGVTAAMNLAMLVRLRRERGTQEVSNESVYLSAWGLIVLYLILSLVADVAPSAAGGLAVLLIVATLIGGEQLIVALQGPAERLRGLPR